MHPFLGIGELLYDPEGPENPLALRVGGFPIGMFAIPHMGEALGIPNGNNPNRIQRAGYRLGNRVSVPANTANLDFFYVGTIPRVNRYKVTFTVTDPEGNVPTPILNAAYGVYLRFTIKGAIENDVTTRYVTVGLNNSAIVYVPGRSLHITVTNVTDYGLVTSVSIDEAAGGISQWEDVQAVQALNTSPYYVQLRPAPFTQVMTLLTPSSATPQPTLNGFDYAGNLVYKELLATPRSGVIPYSPSLSYQLVPAVFPFTGSMLYGCEG